MIAIIGDLPPSPVLAVLKGLALVIPRSTPFFMPHVVSPERIWSNPKVREAFTSPRRKEMYLSAGGKKFCLGTALGLLNALDNLREVVIPGLSVPFYVAHGTKDYGVPLAGTEYLLEHSTTSEDDKCVRIIEGAYHSLLCEDDRMDTMKSVIDWMDNRQ